MRRTACIAILSVSAILIAGCGTTQTSRVGDFSPFAGTRLDAWIAQHYPSDRYLAILDWPFSLIADTVLLPVSTMLYPYNALEGDYGQAAR
ncbi:MAG TPA: YceK/YidQ family lipoprotein [Planctomycetota bacterium]|jgi:uncharacterized protein YceK|nr:YceK/YidQ family lipoprotein [Planctomycetota bacterium]